MTEPERVEYRDLDFGSKFIFQDRVYEKEDESWARLLTCEDGSPPQLPTKHRLSAGTIVVPVKDQ